MYCVNCGIRLGDTEKQCPLCNTDQQSWQDLRPRKDFYPPDRNPAPPVRSAAVNGALLFLFAIPIVLFILVDMKADQMLNWCYYAAGAVALAYILLVFPFWFCKPNPVIFVPCDFAAVALYTLMIERLVGGNWFLPFALPVIAGLALPVCAMVTLLRYLRKGRLYIFGGFLLALGGLMLLTEFLMTGRFAASFIGWSLYPLVVLALLGGLLIFLGINKTAREKMERRFFL